MDDLSPDEMTAFVDIYGAHGEPPVAPEVIESLARRGLIKQYSDGKVRLTAKGTELYERMQGDEPYEGV